jgi:hypothetical protein
MNKKKTANFKNGSQQLVASLAMAGQVAMMNPHVVNEILPDQAVYAKTGREKDDDLALDLSVTEYQEIIAKLNSYVNGPAGHLETESQLYLEQQLSLILGFDVRHELEGKKLNHSIGIMGAEQHLMRYPGDTLDKHDAYREAGIAPKRGAFSWFTEAGQLSEEAIMREKYYFAVQLMYLPNWNQDYPELKPWYKYRKMIMINPSEQVAVVGVVADAGPAAWVQKQFGGSPEVIREGKVWSNNTRGRVILLFVDDLDNKIPLGPIDISVAAKISAQ